MVKVPGGAMTAGFATGRLRKKVDVPDFQIMKHPTTRADYQACEKAGACTEVTESTCTRSALESFGPISVKNDNAPLTCISTEQARDYCQWIGGRLPTLAEWQYAARGSEPQRFPWGTKAPNCDQHPLGLPAVEQTNTNATHILGSVQPCLMMKKDLSLVVGKHPAGASRFNVEDLLITPAELLSTDAEVLVAGCRDGFDGCIVYGFEPGAIDSVSPIRFTDANSDSATSLKVYSFRCVMEG